jgi:hypothetical protein
MVGQTYPSPVNAVHVMYVTTNKNTNWN